MRISDLMFLIVFDKDDNGILDSDEIKNASFISLSESLISDLIYVITCFGGPDYAKE